MQNGAAKISFPAFNLVGISQMISNEKDQAVHAINGLWTRFYNESVIDKIEEKQGVEVYAVYSDYEGDYTKPYRITIGCKSGKTEIAAPLYHLHIPAANYTMFISTGDQPQALIETWQDIWDAGLPRSFRYDMEIYGPRFFEPGVHEVRIYIGIEHVAH